MQRRRFLRRVAGVSALYSLESLGLSGCASHPTAPSTSESAIVNVRAFGARGDGATDDTEAFAAAIRALPPEGIVDVPDGVYRIDPLRAIVLPGESHLRMSPGTVLQAIPVAPAQSAVVRVRNVSNVRITGGTVIGERWGHLGVGGEWGFGIDVRGSTDVVIEGVTARDCWGDGFYVGSTHERAESERVTIRNCRSLDNRRQGLSITACIEALVADSEFSGSAGTSPESGIDLEPNLPYVVRGVTVRGCVASGNAGCGVLLVGETTTGCTVERTRCVDNGGGGVALVHGPADCVVRQNVIEWNATTGLQLHGTTGITVLDNTIRHNSQRGTGRWPNAWVYGGSHGNAFTDNRFVDAAQPPVVPGADILVERSCGATRIVGNALRPRRVDAQGRVIGGVQNDSESTVEADNF